MKSSILLGVAATVGLASYVLSMRYSGGIPIEPLAAEDHPLREQPLATKTALVDQVREPEPAWESQGLTLEELNDGFRHRRFSKETLSPGEWRSVCDRIAVGSIKESAIQALRANMTDRFQLPEIPENRKGITKEEREAYELLREDLARGVNHSAAALTEAIFDTIGDSSESSSMISAMKHEQIDRAQFYDPSNAPPDPKEALSFGSSTGSIDGYATELRFVSTDHPEIHGQFLRIQEEHSALVAQLVAFRRSLE